VPQVVIDNPILNSPFDEPRRHFKFDDEGITSEILTGRRPSSHFVPIPRAKKKSKQLQFETEWTKDRIEPNPVVDRIRQRVGAWRQGGHVGVTAGTSRLLEYWTREGRDKPLFFCQVEAAETAVYITEVARKYGDAWIENDLRTANDTSNPGLPRVALKMATGSGKTVVMAMLIAWQALNKLDDRQDARLERRRCRLSDGSPAPLDLGCRTHGQRERCFCRPPLRLTRHLK
jgi:type III restriction enzyme